MTFQVYIESGFLGNSVSSANESCMRQDGQTQNSSQNILHGEINVEHNNNQ